MFSFEIRLVLCMLYVLYWMFHKVYNILGYDMAFQERENNAS